MSDPATREDPPFWGYRDVAIFAGLAVPSLFSGALLARGLLALFHIRPARKAFELLPGQFLGYGLLFLALYALFLLQYRRSFWRAMRWEWPPIPLPAISSLGVMTAIGVALAGALLHTPDSPMPMKELLSDWTSLLVVMLFGITLGPFCEELAFRGFLQPLVVHSLGDKAGVLLTGAAFGALHLPQYGLSWRHGLLITLAGSAFGWMRLKTGSTAASTFMHASYNLTLFLGFLAGGKDVPRSW